MPMRLPMRLVSEVHFAFCLGESRVSTVFYSHNPGRAGLISKEIHIALTMGLFPQQDLSFLWYLIRVVFPSMQCLCFSAASTASHFETPDLSTTTLACSWFILCVGCTIYCLENWVEITSGRVFSFYKGSHFIYGYLYRRRKGGKNLEMTILLA